MNKQRKGGYARAASMTPEQRSESARKAVRARWNRRAPGAVSSALFVVFNGTMYVQSGNKWHPIVTTS